MTIAPIHKTVSVAAPPERVFALFTGHMGAWWPKGMTVGASPAVEIVIEPRSGGRWFERSQDKVETNWGRVLEWDPPGRVLLAWQLDASFTYDPNFETEIELIFTPEPGGTRVSLEHRNLERFGDSAERMAASLGGGWPGIIDGFAAYAEKTRTEKGARS
jgi:uncharacterized protein YndB with AHSA1/START domain